MKPALSWAIFKTDFWIISLRISKFDWSELSIVSAAILKIEIAASKPSWDWALASDIPCNLPSFNPSSFPFKKASFSTLLILSSINASFSLINCLLSSSSKLFWFVVSLFVSRAPSLSMEILSFSWSFCSCSLSFSMTSSKFASLAALRAISSNDLFLKALSLELFELSALKGACLTVFKILAISAFLRTWGSPV